MSRKIPKSVVCAHTAPKVCSPERDGQLHAEVSLHNRGQCGLGGCVGLPVNGTIEERPRCEPKGECAEPRREDAKFGHVSCPIRSTHAVVRGIGPSISSSARMFASTALRQSFGHGCTLASLDRRLCAVFIGCPLRYRRSATQHDFAVLPVISLNIFCAFLYVRIASSLHFQRTKRDALFNDPQRLKSNPICRNPRSDHVTQSCSEGSELRIGRISPQPYSAARGAAASNAKMSSASARRQWRPQIVMLLGSASGWTQNSAPK